MTGPVKSTPTPSETRTAHRASALQAPSRRVNPAQKPPARQRRAISALIGPGGQATDQPRRKPVARRGRRGAVMSNGVRGPGGGFKRRKRTNPPSQASHAMLVAPPGAGRFRGKAGAKWQAAIPGTGRLDALQAADPAEEAAQAGGEAEALPRQTHGLDLLPNAGPQ